MNPLRSLRTVGLALAAVTAFAHGDEHGAAIGTPGKVGQVTRTVSVDMTDSMRFNPSSIRVKQGDTIRFVVKNSGQLKHEFVLGTEKELKEHYEVMKTYCPYTNLRAAPYPAILARTSLHDSQVMYWEPAKYVARLRALKTDERLLLFKINLAAGHGGASGRYDYLREIAFDYAFVLTQLGLAKSHAPDPAPPEGGG